MHLETILTFHKQVWREESHCGFRKPEGYHTAPDHDEANAQQDHHHLLWGRWFRMKLLPSSMESTWIVCGQLTPESVVNAWKGKCQNSTFLSFPWPMSFYFFRNFPPPIHLPPPPPSRSACEVLNLALRTFFYYQLFKCNKRLMPYFHATSIEWVSVCHNQFFCKLIRTVAVSPLAVSPLLKWWNAQFENKLISRRRKKAPPLNSSISETHLISTICDTVQEADAVLRREEVPQAFAPSVLNQRISWPCIGQKQKSYRVWRSLFAFRLFFPVTYHTWAQWGCLRAENTLYSCGQQQHTG